MRRALYVAALSAWGALGCGSARQSEPLTGSLVLSREQQHGQVLFHQYCHQCHPHGEAGLGPAINNKPAPLAVVRLQVRSGLGAMPAFPEGVLPDKDLEQLLAFVRAQRAQAD